MNLFFGTFQTYTIGNHFQIPIIFCAYLTPLGDKLRTRTVLKQLIIVFQLDLRARHKM